MEGSADSAGVPPAPSVPVSAVTSCSAAPAVVSDVALPSPPVAADAKFSPAPVNQCPPSLHSPGDQPRDVENTPAQPGADAEVEDASLTDKTSSSSPTNDAAMSPPKVTKAESSIQLRDAADDTSLSVPASESS